MLNVQALRQDFPILQNAKMQNHNLIYFDNAATTFKPKQVLDAISYYYNHITANAHRGDYDLSHQVDTIFENTRKTVSDFINAESKEIVFTSGASESLNLVAQGYGEKFLKKGDIVLSTEAEHASCVLPWMKICEKVGAKVEFISLNEQGLIDINHFTKLLEKSVKVVAIAHITNVLGAKNDIKKICKLAHEKGAIVVIDGAQSVPHLSINVKDIDCDFLAFSGHKMCGPTGIGVLYGKYHLLQSMDPFQMGGGSNSRFDMCGNIKMRNAPFKFESGTPNIEGVFGLQAALQYLTDIGMDSINAYEKDLKTYAIQRMKDLNHIKIYNPDADSGIITFNVKGIFAQDAASVFNGNGIAVRSGQHCAKLLSEKLGTSATIRASLYFYNTFEEIDYFLEVCKKISKDSFLDVFF